jgi:hypothetical protein
MTLPTQVCAIIAYVEILHNIWYYPFHPDSQNLFINLVFHLANRFTAAMPTVSPAALRSLIKTNLTSDQLVEAYGDFSHSKQATDYNHTLSVWFSATASSSIKRVIVGSDDTAGVLVFNKGVFTVISNVTQGIDTSGKVIFTGHIGNELSTIVPTEVSADELLGESFVLLMKETASPEPNLDDLMCTKPASDTVVSTDHVEKGIFDEATSIQDPPNLDGMYITKMPLCIPLPFGHNVKSTMVMDEDGVQALCDELSNIDNQLLLWLKSMHFNVMNTGGISLHDPTLKVPQEYFVPFQTTGPQVHTAIKVSPSPLVPTFQLAKNVVACLIKVRESNVDTWIQSNKPIDPIMMTLLPLLIGGTPPPTNQPTINVQVAKTQSDKRQEVQKAKTIAIASLLLANVDEANDVLVPAKLSNEFLELVDDGTAKTALRTFQTQFGDFCSLRCSNTASVIHHNTNMPMGVVTAAFVGAFIKVYWLSTNLHDTNGVVSQNLSVFTLLPAQKKSVGYKHIRDETNTAHGEQMVGETSSNTTKISTELFSSGEQSTYIDLKAAVSNVHALLSFMVDETDHKTSCILLDLTSLYDMLASHLFEEWFQYYSTGDVTWLCHSILVDIHNVLRHMVIISMMPSLIRDVISQTDITASTVLTNLEQAIAVTIHKWTTSINQNNLSSYNSKPSTWAKLCKTSDTQDLNKKPKSSKGSKNSSISSNSDGPTNGNNNNSNTNRNNGTNNS